MIVIYFQYDTNTSKLRCDIINVDMLFCFDRTLHSLILGQVFAFKYQYFVSSLISYKILLSNKLFTSTSKINSHFLQHKYKQQKAHMFFIFQNICKSTMGSCTLAFRVKAFHVKPWINHWLLKRNIGHHILFMTAIQSRLKDHYKHPLFYRLLMVIGLEHSLL